MQGTGQGVPVGEATKACFGMAAQVGGTQCRRWRYTRGVQVLWCEQGADRNAHEGVRIRGAGVTVGESRCEACGWQFWLERHASTGGRRRGAEARGAVSRARQGEKRREGTGAGRVTAAPQCPPPSRGGVGGTRRRRGRLARRRAGAQGWTLSAKQHGARVQTLNFLLSTVMNAAAEQQKVQVGPGPGLGAGERRLWAG